MLEKLASDKYSSLLQKFVKKSFITLGPEWGERKPKGENLIVVWAEFSSLS